MKTEMMKKFKLHTMTALAVTLLFVTACGGDDDAPKKENVVEVFTDVTLIFTNKANASDVVKVTAKDPDGAGAKPLEVKGKIYLTAGATYTLTYEIKNALDPKKVEDLAKEILEEADEHQLFYAFTKDIFASPSGDGNIDKASDPINYKDKDKKNYPLGLKTEWTTGAAYAGYREFRVKLQHQPDVKTATSGSTDGDTDFDLKFKINMR